jgi:hypothetical protein
LVFTLRFFQSEAMETRDLTAKTMPKMPKIACNWSSRVKASGHETDLTCQWLSIKMPQQVGYSGQLDVFDGYSGCA